uniref:Uncharacterized protein n=2 Tax=Moniliophthora roreri TaxID=221103 RepID=A0A0W0G589_MONRR
MSDINIYLAGCVSDVSPSLPFLSDYMDKRRNTRIFIFSHLRTASHLFFRIMESHPSLTIKQYPFMEAFFFGPERLSVRRSDSSDDFFANEEAKFAGHTFQKCLDDMETLIKDIESEGKYVMLKEHTVHLITSRVHEANIEEKRPFRPTPVLQDHCLDLDEAQRVDAMRTTTALPIPNPTILPDRLLKTLTPVFIIRHPALVFPSYLRASKIFGATAFDDDAPFYMTLKWQRLLLDFYKTWYSCPEGAKSAGPGREHFPIVIDADKLINDSHGQIDKLCRLLGLDPAPIRFTWEAQDRSGNRAQAAFLTTISNSTGVIKSKGSKLPVLEDEAREWAKEWDVETVQAMKSRTEDAMEDYEYMLKHSI